MLDLCCADDGQAINNYLIQNMRKSGEALNQVRESLAQGFSENLRARIWILLFCSLTQDGLFLQKGAKCRCTAFFLLCYSGVRQPVQALPTPLRPAPPHRRGNANGAEPEHSALQPGHLRESRQRQGESESESLPSFNLGASVASEGKKEDEAASLCCSSSFTCSHILHSISLCSVSNMEPSGPGPTSFVLLVNTRVPLLK